MLILKIVLGPHHVIDDLLLYIFRQLHIFHTGIRHIQLFLQNLGLSVNRLINTSNRTKYIRIEKSPSYKKHYIYQYQLQALGSNIISSQHQDCIVKGKDVLD